MHIPRFLSLVLATGLLAACNADADPYAGQAFPMAAPTPFNQPIPTKPLWGDPIVTAHSVLPHAKPDVGGPLPPLAPLPQATHTEAAPQSEGAAGGAVNPAAGQAAAISDGQGEGNKQVLGAPK